jgi:hypothetical protein
VNRIPPAALLAGLLALCPGAARAQATNAPGAAGAPADAFAALAGLDTLSEVVRHLYRWYLDEKDFDETGRAPEVLFHIRPLTPPLDADDRSLYAEIAIPALKATVRMKKTDYTIAELGVTVRSDRFRIVNVEKTEGAAPAGGQVVRYPTADLKDYLFRTRAQPDFPSPALGARLRTALTDEIRENLAKTKDPAADQTVFVAPLSPVANEIWAYWVEGRMLVRWASDIELENPAVWNHERLAVKTVDVERQALLSFGEAAGSNAFYTRDQVGRALYNCVVLGEKRVVPAANIAGAPPAAAAP